MSRGIAAMLGKRITGRGRLSTGPQQLRGSGGGCQQAEDAAKRLTTDPSLFAPRALPETCGQEKSRVEAEELPFWQPLIPGSLEHYESVNRRNAIEGFFGNVKNEASQSLRRGQIRVMGLAKVSLMAMFIVMAANLRLIDSFETKQAERARRAAEDAAGSPVAPARTRKPGGVPVSARR